MNTSTLLSRRNAVHSLQQTATFERFTAFGMLAEGWRLMAIDALSFPLGLFAPHNSLHRRLRQLLGTIIGKQLCRFGQLRAF